MADDSSLLTVTRPALHGAPRTEITHFSLLYDVSRSFSELIELDELVPFVVARTKELLKAESCAVLLLDAARHELYFPYSADVTRDVEQRLAEIRFPADRGIAGWVLREGIPQLVADVSRDPRWYPQVDHASGMVTTSLLCAPLRTRRGPVGVIELRNKVENQFTGADLDFLDALSGSIAIAIENASLYQTLRESEARLRQEVVALNREVASHSRFADIVGSSAAMDQVFRLMESAINVPVTVLLQGETGTGKELIARAIHYNGLRRDRSFVAVNCGALPEGLLESALFGHKRGSFTGAVADRKGLFEVADGGSIFLDEVGDMTPAMQVELLRVLQDGEILPIGESRPRRVNVRVISATNRDLQEEVTLGRFREDLFYRLSTFPIHVPPLRARKEDIPLLVAHSARHIAEKFGQAVHGVAPAVLKLFADYPWPGNVRELENELERAAALVGTGDPIQPQHLSDKFATKRAIRLPKPGSPSSLRRARSAFEEEYIADVLQHNGGNASQAAKVLGISRVMLQKKIKTYGLRAKLERDPH